MPTAAPDARRCPSPPAVIAVEVFATPKVSPSAKLVFPATVTSLVGTPTASLWSVASPPQFANLLSVPGVAGTPLDIPSLGINAGTLPPRETLVFRLTASNSNGAASADVTVRVSGAPYGPAGPGSAGAIAVSPASGFGLETPFAITATGWDDTDQPLQYSFSYTILGAAAGPPVVVASFGPAPFATATLPAGLPAANYTVNVTVLVRNAYGAVADPVSKPVQAIPKRPTTTNPNPICPNLNF